jgi:16S rRNA (cytosine967-C5)-methyltransferase
VRWPSGDPADLPQVRSGAAGIQDEGSQLVVLALAAAPLEGPDTRWLDLCAGPGGKAALLAGLAGSDRSARSPGPGPVLLAVDPQPHRARLVQRALADPATGPVGRAWTVVADGRTGPWHPGSFDRVLADVPCTGLGALRRRPDARWRRRPADVARLGPLQRALLSAAVDAVRPGGLVGYATCSPHLAETEVVVGDVLASRPDLQVVDARPLFVGLPDLGPGPFVQLWPHRHGTDAMFLAVLRRTG